MKIFLIKVMCILLIVTLQQSFLNILFPLVEIPILILAALTSLVLVFGFREGAIVWLGLLVGYDVLRMGNITFLLPTGILIAYAISFISRRYIFEHRGIGLFFLSGATLLAGIGYKIVAVLFFQEKILQSQTLVALFSLGIIFPLVFVWVQWIEEKIRFIQQSEFRELKRPSL